MKKYTKPDQKLLATWSADCALRVLHLFEQARPKDARARQAIRACRTWVRTGVFKMAVIRAASLGAHAAARAAKAKDSACFAARAAGQAVATAHVTQHAVGGAFYALKAIAAANPATAPAKVAKEHTWQSRRLSQNLRSEFLRRISIKKHADQVLIKIIKDQNF